jgi:amino acid adenylation domain-containing protein
MLPFAREEVEGSLPERFAKVAAAHSSDLAIAAGEARISYGELRARVDALAAEILDQVGPGQAPISVVVRDPVAITAAILATWEVGRLCVPIAADLPPARIASILSHSESELVITDAAPLVAADSAAGARRELRIDLLDCLASGGSVHPIVPGTTPACILYTSGSTGEPKGVVRTHRSLLHRAHGSIASLGIRPHDRVSIIHSLASAAGIRDMLAALLGGAALFIFDLSEAGFRELSRWIDRERITVLCGAVSTWRHAFGSLDPGVRFDSLRMLRLGSEPIYRADVERLRKHLHPDCVLVTGYGATEASGVTEYRMTGSTSLTSTRIPAGYPLQGVELAVQDDDGHPVAAGDPGEVVVRCPYLASGYWRAPQLTHSAFETDAEGRICAYRTGDIGRLRPDGGLELLGRRDDQIKMRGYRVNPGEIELALAEQPRIAGAAVTSAVAANGEARLVAYVVPRASPAPTPALLRRDLETRLPAYMIPSAFVVVNALPLTASGKVDRRALPAPPEPETVREGPFVAPRTPTEHQLAAIWEEIFGVPRIGATDDFFDLGGDSLRAATLVAGIETALGRTLAPSVLLRAPKLAELAKAINDEQRLDGPVTALQAKGNETAIFFLHNDEGRGLYTHALARALGTERPFYAVHRDGFDAGRAPSVEELAASGTQALRSVRPKGPYVIGGHCNGGMIALEMARQLRESGEEVELVVMVDTRAPSLRARLRRRIAGALGPLRSPVIRGLEQQARLWARVYREMGWRAHYYRERAVMFGRAGIREQVALARRKLASTRGAEPSDQARGFRFHADLPALDSTRTQRRAIRRYAPPRYTGRVALFRAEEFPAPKPDLGWSALLPRLEVVVVPGDHHSCITRHVATFAARLEEALRRARR